MKELAIVDTRTDCHVHLTLRLRSGARVSHELERIARSYARLGGPLLMFGIPNHLQDRIEIAAAEDAIVMAWSSANQTVQSWTFGETQSR